MMRTALVAAAMSLEMRAGLISLEETLRQVMKHSGVAPGNSSFTGPGLRNLPNTATQAFDDFFRPYGCWCYFQQDEHSIKYGRGSPIDTFDSLCKRLQEMYECIVYDSRDRGEPCNPWEIQYDIEDDYLFETGQMIHSGSDEERTNALTESQWWCRETQGRDLCKREVCQAELTFIIDLWALVISETSASDMSQSDNLSNIIVQDNFVHNGFEREMNCISPAVATAAPVDPVDIPAGNGGAGNGGAVASPTVPIIEKKCCGNHPFRFPYKVAGGRHECCQANDVAFDWDGQPWQIGKGKVYSATLHVCCADGSIKSIGDVC